jgi:hypothetical protein
MGRFFRPAARCALFFVLAVAIWPRAQAQSQPFTHTFTAGDVQSYRVELLVRSEIEGQRPARIGVKDYAEPFARFAEARVSWVATRRVVAVDDDGAAEIHESLDQFSAVASRAATENEAEWKQLAATLQRTLEDWAVPRTLRYRETRTGQLVVALSSAGAPALDESAPRVLSPWLLRAMRPTVALPAPPIRFGERWQEPRSVNLPPWTDAQGVEAGEWLDSPGFIEPAVRLHITQQISAKASASESLPHASLLEPAARFHGESLATILLINGRLLRAERSATREITWSLPPVEGREQPAGFKARLSVQVRIEECRESCR